MSTARARARVLSRRRLLGLAGAGATLTAAGVLAPPGAQALVADSAAGRPGPLARWQRPVVVGHRGAAGYRPEHTLASYRLAIELGADIIEPDVVSTRDGVLVSRHENEISGTTDVADHPEFADRRSTKVVDGVPLVGWFTEDFTFAELRTLRAVERLPDLRPRNTRFDGLFPVPSLAEVIDLAQRESAARGRTIGIIPETKHPTYFDGIGLSLEEPLLRELRRAGWERLGSPVLIQSFEVSNLRELDARTGLPLVQLVGATGAPYDQVVAGTGLTYADMVTRRGLRDVARYADVLGPDKNVLIPRRADDSLGEPTQVVADAHRAGLDVVPYTFRDENFFLPSDFDRGTDPARHGDAIGELLAFFGIGIDGLFGDFPDTSVKARRRFLSTQPRAA